MLSHTNMYTEKKNPNPKTNPPKKNPKKQNQEITSLSSGQMNLKENGAALQMRSPVCPFP